MEPTAPNEKNIQRITPQAEEELIQKINVDQAAIQEAKDAVGDDEQKIREYLINNRGL